MSLLSTPPKVVGGRGGKRRARLRHRRSPLVEAFGGQQSLRESTPNSRGSTTLSPSTNIACKLNYVKPQAKAWRRLRRSPLVEAKLCFFMFHNTVIKGKKIRNVGVFQSFVSKKLCVDNTLLF